MLRPNVIPSNSISKYPERTASNMINATMVDKMSVNADSKLSIDFVSSVMEMQYVLVSTQ